MFPLCLLLFLPLEGEFFDRRNIMADTVQSSRIFSPGEYVSEIHSSFNDYCNDVFLSVLGKPAPEGIKSIPQLFSKLADNLSASDYSYEKITKPLVSNKTAEEKVEDYIERAYYNSKAYADRAVRSLGYEKVEDMTPEDKAVYDRIISRGKNISFLQRDDSLGTSLFDVFTNKYSIDQNPSKGEQKIDLLSVPHEMGHFLYSTDESGLHPGVNTLDDNITLNEDEIKYGRENSPLATINQDTSSISKLKENYSIYINEEVKALMAIDGWKNNLSYVIDELHTSDPQKLTIQMIKLHDDQGVERGADVHSYRMMMLKEGFWNPFDGSDVTPEQVEKFHKAHPHARIFQYWDNNKAGYYMNNIAQSNKPETPSLNELRTNARDLLASLNDSSDVIEEHQVQGVNYSATSLASANFETESQEQVLSEEQQQSRGFRA